MPFIPSVIKNKAFRGCLSFIIFLSVFVFIIYVPVIREEILNPLELLIATQSAWILKTLGVQISLNGTILTNPSFAFHIKDGCNAIYEIGTYWAAITAFPANFKHKLIGYIGSWFFIYIFNLFRVVLLFVLGVYNKPFFNISHDHISQSAFIFLMAVSWLFWALYTDKRTSGQ